MSFSSLSFRKTKLISLLFVFAISISLFPFHIAHAGFWEGLSSTVGNFFGGLWHGITHAAGDVAKSTANFLLSGIITVIFVLLAAIGAALMNFAEGLFMWVTSPDFINWGSNCTIGGHLCTAYVYNPIVNLGWGVVRDFTNMLFIIGLVIIGLATIIGYKDYAAQKTLPLLIGVALLINFTPLICGIVIDATNIVMNFFLNNGGRVISHDWFSTLSNQFSNVVKGQWFSSDLSGLGERMGKAIMYLTFDYVSAFVFILYALLFLVRYVVLWLLIIISPLAFFAYIFPGSRNYFHQWWHHFIQWSIIGIIPAFLLFLANSFIGSGASVGGTGTAQLAGAGFTTEILIYFVPTILLLVGLYFALNTSAVGANIITGAFQEHVIGRVRKGIRKGTELARKHGRESKFGRAWERTKGKIKERIPVIGGELGAEWRREERKRYEEIKNNLSYYAPHEREKFARRWGERGRIALAEMKLEGGKKLTEKDLAYLEKGLKDNYIKPKEITKIRPDLAGKVKEVIEGRKLSEEEKKEAIREVIRKQSPKSLRENIAPEAINVKTATAMTVEQIREFAKKGSPEKIEALANLIPRDRNDTARINILKKERNELKSAIGSAKTPQELEKARENLRAFNQALREIARNPAIRRYIK